MESPKELREKYHGNKRARGAQFWGHRFFIHVIPSYLTWVFIRTKVTANQVTVVMVLSGILGSLVMAVPGFTAKMVGVAFVYLGIALDGLDGDLARYRGTFSLRGIYLDDIQHLIVPPLFIIATAFSVSKSTMLNSDLIVIAGILAGIALTVIKVNGKEPFHIMGKHFLRDPRKYDIVDRSRKQGRDTVLADSPIVGSTSMLRKILSVRFQFRQFLFIVLVFFTSLLVERMLFAEFATYPITTWLIVLYGAFLVLHTIEEVVKGYFYIDGWVANLYKGLVENNEKLHEYQKSEDKE